MRSIDTIPADPVYERACVRARCKGFAEFSLEECLGSAERLAVRIYNLHRQADVCEMYREYVRRLHHAQFMRINVTN